MATAPSRAGFSRLILPRTNLPIIYKGIQSALRRHGAQPQGSTDTPNPPLEHLTEGCIMGDDDLAPTLLLVFTFVFFVVFM